MFCLLLSASGCMPGAGTVLDMMIGLAPEHVHLGTLWELPAFNRKSGNIFCMSVLDCFSKE